MNERDGIDTIGIAGERALADSRANARALHKPAGPSDG